MERREFTSEVRKLTIFLAHLKLVFLIKIEIIGKTKMTGKSHGEKSYTCKRIEAISARSNPVYTQPFNNKDWDDLTCHIKI